MKQALHIFKKDVRYLRYDIGITLLAVVAFMVMGIRQPSFLGVFLPVIWWFLIARVVHAEALPGHRQFWLTRPYRWKSLLGAKVLFIFVFVNLPLLAADMVIIRAVGFSIGQEVAGLLWTQVLLITAFVLPAAAFAAITSGLGELLFATSLMVLGILVLFITGYLFHGLSPWFELEWVKTYCFVVELAAAAAIILLWQYARRNTFATRVVACATAFVFLASSALLPWTAAFALQTHLSQRNIAPASIRIELDSDRKWLGRVYPAEHDQMVAELPLQISGVPVGTEFKPNGLTVILRAADGNTWIVNQPPPSSFDFEGSITSLRAVMGKDFYTKEKNQPLQLRGTLFFTLYGNKQNARIALNGGSVPVNNVGLCSAGARFLKCDSVFRTPSDSITIRILQDFSRGAKTATASPFPSTSYSPFPADFNIDPLYRFFSPQPVPISEAQVETFEPIAHIKRDFEIDDVRLNDFVAKPPGVIHVF